MFIREAHLVCSLRHPNLAQGIEAFEANSTAYLVMRYVSGKSLFEHLRMTKGGFEATPRSIAALLLPLAEAVSSLHEQGAIHCDIKPDNIILGLGQCPILIDLGAACFGDPSRGWERPATYFPHFAAIEQHSSKFGSPGPWTDIYQLAVVIYRCLTRGKIPDSRIRAKSRQDPYLPLVEVPALVRTYPRTLLETIDRGLKVLPLERPRSVREWLEPAMPDLVALYMQKTKPATEYARARSFSDSRRRHQKPVVYLTSQGLIQRLISIVRSDPLISTGFFLLALIIAVALLLVQQCSA